MRGPAAFSAPPYLSSPPPTAPSLSLHLHPHPHPSLFTPSLRFHALFVWTGAALRGRWSVRSCMPSLTLILNKKYTRGRGDTAKTLNACQLVLSLASTSPLSYYICSEFYLCFSLVKWNLICQMSPISNTSLLHLTALFHADPCMRSHASLRWQTRREYESIYPC